MKVIFAALLSFLTISIIFPSTASAAKSSPPCPAGQLGANSLVEYAEIPDTAFTKDQLSVNVYFRGNKVDPSKKYFIIISENNILTDERSNEFYTYNPSQLNANFTAKVPDKAGKYTVKLRTYSTPPSINGEEVCDLGTFSAASATLSDTTCQISMPKEIKTNDAVSISLNGSKTPYNGYLNPQAFGGLRYAFFILPKSQITQVPKGILSSDGLPTKAQGRQPNTVFIGTETINEVPYNVTLISKTAAATGMKTQLYSLAPDDYIAAMKVVNFKGGFANESYYCAVFPFMVGNDLKTTPVASSAPINPPGTPGSPGDGKLNFVTCDSNDVNCVRGGGIVCANGGVQTAIGCVPTNPVDFVNGLMAFTAGAGGGIALLLMVSGSFQMITSQGSPDQLKKGREQFIAAATGLLFIIFSVTLLRIIGVNILQIPGFN